MSVKAEDIRNEHLVSRKWNIRKTFLSDYRAGVLVTGANSFLGVHIVKALLEHDTGPVHLLLRATTVPEAISRMQQAYLNWGLGEFDPDKVTIHTGDVTRNMMGMTQSAFRSLSRATGAVVHLAMTPLYHLPYHHFQRIWVPELERMIAFCADPEAPKSLHYASSFNASFFQTGDDFRALNTNAWQSGYAGFKWVAGKALENAFRQHLRGCVYDIPLVLGTERAGICPRHYSIWMILDIFLKTGHYFPFSFRVMPVDKLAEVIAFNIRQEREGLGAAFIRPFLEEPVTDELFSRTVAGMLGLRRSDLETVRGMCQNRLRFDFLLPGNFYELMEKVNRLPAVFPGGFDTGQLPLTPMIFMSNLNRAMSSNKEMIKV